MRILEEEAVKLRCPFGVGISNEDGNRNLCATKFCLAWVSYSRRETYGYCRRLHTNTLLKATK